MNVYGDPWLVAANQAIMSAREAGRQEPRSAAGIPAVAREDMCRNGRHLRSESRRRSDGAWRCMGCVRDARNRRKEQAA